MQANSGRNLLPENSDVKNSRGIPLVPERIPQGAGGGRVGSNRPLPPFQSTRTDFPKTPIEEKSGQMEDHLAQKVANRKKVSGILKFSKNSSMSPFGRDTHRPLCGSNHHPCTLYISKTHTGPLPPLLPPPETTGGHLEVAWTSPPFEGHPGARMDLRTDLLERMDPSGAAPPGCQWGGHRRHHVASGDDPHLECPQGCRKEFFRCRLWDRSNPQAGHGHGRGQGQGCRVRLGPQPAQRRLVAPGGTLIQHRPEGKGGGARGAQVRRGGPAVRQRRPPQGQLR